MARAMGGDLWLVGVQPDLRMMMERSEQDEVLGDDHVFRGKGEAIARVYPQLDTGVCRTCPAQIFQECRRSLPDGTPREQPDAARPGAA